ncbi:AAA ATPase cdc48 [Stygiomarasmius scandens]|uniref:AAA ATPase cdc48 n=1 Tax=Marasmiellus scandens TaxID=2682957 RepID=A0ABR1ING8_9AGAR
MSLPTEKIECSDPSGAPPQPGPNDTSTAILRPKKSPNCLIVDEATSDDNSVATLNPATMETLQLFRGDTIIIRGKKRRDTVLICLSSDKVEEGRIQMNKVARNNLRVKLAAMQQICEKMDLIDLDEDTIDAKVLDALGVTMDNF